MNTFRDHLGFDRAYFHHPYNSTFDNERAIEVPLARSFILERPDGPGLEVGNVLRHYGPAPWMVVDKYEEDERVINVDVMDWEPPCRLAWIMAISTVEHIGWDESPRDPVKAVMAITRMRSWLLPGGVMMITVPMGHHEALDPILLANGLDAKITAFYERGPQNTWTIGEPKPTAYNREVPSASALWVGEFWE